MRKTPYTKAGLKRIPCFRCRGPSVFQWQICADNNTYRGICADCDIKLNELVLDFMGDPDAESKMTIYRISVSRRMLG